MTSPATRHIDYSGILKESVLAEESRLVPEYVQDYFLRAFQRFGGKVTQRGDVFSISSVPYELRQWNDNYAFKTLYGTIFREYRRVTFDKSYARSHSDSEFMAPGHPLLEVINEEILTTFKGGRNTCAIFGDPEYNRRGVFWFVEGDVSDGTGSPAGKRVFCLYQPVSGEIRQVNPAILWDHEPLQDVILPREISELLENMDRIEDFIITDVLMPYRDEIPTKARDLNYRDKMELAYPFHPDLIDILYEKWSTYSTFQRTRGVLRLLANVIEDLYQRESPIDMILPGDINLAHSGIRQEFLKHIGQEYEGVIGSDIAGHEAKSQDLDDANKNWKHLAQRIATSIFYHSFAADDSEKGINLNYIKLAVLRSDTIPALVTDVLQRLSNSLWYLNSRGDLYYLSRIANLNRVILDKKELFIESYEDEMQERIKKELGSKFRPYLWPTNSENIPDNTDLKLIILRAEDSGSDIPNWIEYKGNNYRRNKNTLFFSLADTAQFAHLREQIKTFLALQDIEEEIKSGDSPTLETKRDEVQRRKHAIEREFSYNIRRMYHLIQVGERKIDLGNPITGAESLGNWFWRELTSDSFGVIVTNLHYKVLVNKFMENVDQLSTAALLEQFYKEPSLPSLANQDVLARAIQLGIKEGAFGLAEIKDGEILPNSLKFKEEIPFATITFLEDYQILSAAKSEEILAVQEEEENGGGSPPGGGRPTPGPEPGPGPFPHPRPPVPGEKRYKKVKLHIADIPASKIADVNRGVLLPISSVQGDFKFAIEIDITSEDGITQSTIDNKIKETIRQIGAQIIDEDLEE